MPCKLCINSNTFGDWLWSSCYSRICLTNHPWCCCFCQLSGLWKWQSFLYLNLLVHFPLWALSSMHSGYPWSWPKQRPWHVSTGILSISKVLAFKVMQRITNKRFNRYIKITCLIDIGRVGTLNVRTKVFVGNSSLLQCTFISLTEVTSCEDKSWQLFYSLTPSKSLITPFEEFRDNVLLP